MFTCDTSWRKPEEWDDTFNWLLNLCNTVEKVVLNVIKMPAASPVLRMAAHAWAELCGNIKHCWRTHADNLAYNQSSASNV